MTKSSDSQAIFHKLFRSILRFFTLFDIEPELNGKIIHREELADQTLSENDRVELISFVGGG
ncbi:sulfur carrier protein ThiS [Weissella paramesenteroides]